jgi:hypothetical protein
MWRSVQKAEISEEICMFQPGRWQAMVYDSYLRKPTMRCGSVVYVYIETTTYCSDVQAFIVVTRYTDVFTAGRR